MSNPDDILPALQPALTELGQTPQLRQLLVQMATLMRGQLGNISALAADNTAAHDDLRAQMNRIEMGIEGPFAAMGAALGATQASASVATQSLVERLLAIEAAGNGLDARVIALEAANTPVPAPPGMDGLMQESITALQQLVQHQQQQISNLHQQLSAQQASSTAYIDTVKSELESAIESLGHGGLGSGPASASDGGPDLADLRRATATAKLDCSSSAPGAPELFAEWSLDIRDICRKRSCGIAAMDWGTRQGANPIKLADVPEEYRSFNAELYTLLGTKTGGPAKQLRIGVAEANGLEHWRRLIYDYQPRTVERAANLKVALLTLDHVTVDKLARTITRIEDKFTLHDSMVDEADRITDGEKRAVFVRIAPTNVMKSLRSIRADIGTSEKLKRKLLEHAEDEKADEEIYQIGHAPMELGAVAAPDSHRDGQAHNPVLAAVQELTSSIKEWMKGTNELGALGGDSKGPKCFNCGEPGHRAADCPHKSLKGHAGKGPWSGFKGSAGGKSGGSMFSRFASKGSVSGGKGGKAGKGASQSSLGGNPNSTTLCKHYMKHGWCQFSPNCRFKHVKGSPGGPLSHLSSMAINMGPSYELPADIIPDGSDEVDEGGASSVVKPDREREVAIDAVCGLCGENDAAEFEAYLKEEGF